MKPHHFLLPIAVLALPCCGPLKPDASLCRTFHGTHRIRAASMGRDVLTRQTITPEFFDSHRHPERTVTLTDSDRRRLTTACSLSRVAATSAPIDVRGKLVLEDPRGKPISTLYMDPFVRVLWNGTPIRISGPLAKELAALAWPGTAAP